jgi:hypothetical protein
VAVVGVSWVVQLSPLFAAELADQGGRELEQRRAPAEWFRAERRHHRVPGEATQPFQAPFRVNVTCVTPLGVDVASTS